MIGLGAMGSALARAFLRAGHSVTVWNRTAARMQPLVDLGATAAPSPADAARASPVTVVCIDNYATTRRLLDEAGMLQALAGRTLIQLSTGTPAEARALAGWLNAQGVKVLDGAILPYPDGIGAADARILFAGPAAALPLLQAGAGQPWRRSAPCRRRNRCGGGAGHGPFDPSNCPNTLVSCKAARVCEAEGLGVDVFAVDPAARRSGHRSGLAHPQGRLRHPRCHPGGLERRP